MAEPVRKESPEEAEVRNIREAKQVVDARWWWSGWSVVGDRSRRPGRVRLRV